MLKESLAANRPVLTEQVARTDDPVHLIGIGGIGMAGLAGLLAGRGFSVTGSDLLRNAQTEWLAGRGVRVDFGHAAEQVGEAVKWAVRSTAVPMDQVEVRACLERGIPVYQRGEVLAALTREMPSISVSGTHGKTTTTALIAHVLEHAGRRPGFFVGGERSDRPVADWGDGELIVLEADESDGTLTCYETETAVMTNLEYDHMEHFASREALEECFRRFLSSARKRIVYCGDDAGARRVGRDFPQALTYGFAEGCDLQADECRDEPGRLSFRMIGRAGAYGTVVMPQHGRHNALNALAAFLVVSEYGVSFEAFREALAGYRPVLRRYERCGRWRGAEVISDYAHHPTELRAVMQMALAGRCGGKIRVIFQPHRYTRTRALKTEFIRAFDGAHTLLLCPVYAASEAPIPGGTSRDLLEVLPVFPGGTRLAASPAEAWETMQQELESGDTLLILGAGDVDAIARGMQYDDRNVEKNM
ncbi:MAG: UDP-N-acetylmuramate--L-alanine ligase [Kiritimatiellae bacterium]|nr:UDP-N-acetylmuramate--L-alanine ligase [Kiritimatiellia bacterium]